MHSWIWQDLNLDSANDMAEYILAYRAFRVGRHRVVLAVCPDGDTSFSVDGACDADKVSPFTAAKILLGLLKAWASIKCEISPTGVVPFCYPTETDGLAERRVQMFLKAGFSQPNSEGKMICVL